MLPSDPFMLLSMVNMKLRDDYQNLDDLCASMDIDKRQLIDKLSAAGFEYVESQNQFK